MNSPEELIDELGYYSAAVHGYSMYPLLVDHRDSVFIEKKSRYEKFDVVLFRRKNGQLVLHRVRKIKDGKYICSGDNENFYEIVESDMIIGYMTEFCRNGSVGKNDDWRFKVYSRVWAFSLPTKRLLRFFLKCVVRCKNKFHR